MSNNKIGQYYRNRYQTTLNELRLGANLNTKIYDDSISSAQNLNRDEEVESTQTNSYSFDDTLHELNYNITNGVFDFFEGIGDFFVGTAGWIGSIFGADDQWAKDIIDYDWSKDVATGVDKVTRYIDPINWIENAITNDWSDMNPENFASSGFGGDTSYEQAMYNTSLLNVFGDNVHKGINDFATSIGQQLPSIALGVLTMGGSTALGIAGSTANALAKGVSVASMALSAGGQSTSQALQDGGDLGHSLLYGVLSGAVEAGTEYILPNSSFAGVIGGKAGSTLGRRLAKSFLEEGTEEVISDLVSPIVELTYKNNSSWQEVGEHLKNSYLSTDFIAGLGQSFLMGGASALVLGGASEINNLRKYSPNGYRYANTSADIVNDKQTLDNLNERRNSLIEQNKSTEKVDKRIARIQETINKKSEKLISYAEKLKDKPKQQRRLLEFLNNQSLKGNAELLNKLLDDKTTSITQKYNYFERGVSNMINSFYQRTGRYPKLEYVDSADYKAKYNNGTIYLNKQFEKEYSHIFNHELTHFTVDIMSEEQRNAIYEQMEKQGIAERYKDKVLNSRTYRENQSERSIIDETIANYIEDNTKNFSDFNNTFLNNRLIIPNIFNKESIRRAKVDSEFKKALKQIARNSNEVKRINEKYQRALSKNGNEEQAFNSLTNDEKELLYFYSSKGEEAFNRYIDNEEYGYDMDDYGVEDSYQVETEQESVNDILKDFETDFKTFETMPENNRKIIIENYRQEIADQYEGTWESVDKDIRNQFEKILSSNQVQETNTQVQEKSDSVYYENEDNLEALLIEYEDNYTEETDTKPSYLKKRYVNKVNSRANVVYEEFSDIRNEDLDVNELTHEEIVEIGKLKTYLLEDDRLSDLRDNLQTIIDEVDSGEYPNDDPPDYGNIETLIEYLDSFEAEFETVQVENTINKRDNIEDDFRRLQETSRNLSNKDIQSFHSGSQRIDDSFRRLLETTFKRQINATRNSLWHGDRTLVNKKNNNSFTVVENVDGNLFHNIFEIVNKYLPNGDAVDVHKASDYSKNQNFLSDDGMSGFSITPSGDLISVFSLSKNKGFLYAIRDYIREKGAKTLDCFNSIRQPLAEIYAKTLGFKTASIMDFNYDVLAQEHGKEYADYFVKTYGEAPVAFMVDTNQNVETKHFNKDQYDEAQQYQLSFLKEQKTNFDYSKESIKDFRETRSEQLNNYVDEVNDIVKILDDKNSTYEELEDVLNTLKANLESYIEFSSTSSLYSKYEQGKNEQKNFYNITLAREDLNIIKRLNTSVFSKLDKALANFNVNLIDQVYNNVVSDEYSELTRLKNEVYDELKSFIKAKTNSVLSKQINSKLTELVNTRETSKKDKSTVKGTNEIVLDEANDIRAADFDKPTAIDSIDKWFDKERLFDPYLNTASRNDHVAKVLTSNGETSHIVAFNGQIRRGSGYERTLNIDYFDYTNLNQFVEQIKNYGLHLLQNGYTTVGIRAKFVNENDPLLRALRQAKFKVVASDYAYTKNSKKGFYAQLMFDPSDSYLATLDEATKLKHPTKEEKSTKDAVKNFTELYKNWNNALFGLGRKAKTNFDTLINEMSNKRVENGIVTYAQIEDYVEKLNKAMEAAAQAIEINEVLKGKNEETRKEINVSKNALNYYKKQLNLKETKLQEVINDTQLAKLTKTIAIREQDIINYGQSDLNTVVGMQLSNKAFLTRNYAYGSTIEVSGNLNISQLSNIAEIASSWTNNNSVQFNYLNGVDELTAKFKIDGKTLRSKLYSKVNYKLAFDKFTSFAYDTLVELNNINGSLNLGKNNVEEVISQTMTDSDYLLDPSKRPVTNEKSGGRKILEGDTPQRQLPKLKEVLKDAKSKGIKESKALSGALKNSNGYEKLIMQTVNNAHVLEKAIEDYGFSKEQATSLTYGLRRARGQASTWINDGVDIISTNDKGETITTRSKSLLDYFKNIENELKEYKGKDKKAQRELIQRQYSIFARNLMQIDSNNAIGYYVGDFIKNVSNSDVAQIIKNRLGYTNLNDLFPETTNYLLELNSKGEWVNKDYSVNQPFKDIIVDNFSKDVANLQKAFNDSEATTREKERVAKNLKSWVKQVSEKLTTVKEVYGKIIDVNDIKKFDFSKLGDEFKTRLQDLSKIEGSFVWLEDLNELVNEMKLNENKDVDKLKELARSFTNAELFKTNESISKEFKFAQSSYEILRSYLDALQEKRIQGRLLTRDEVNSMKRIYPHYVPTERVVLSHADLGGSYSRTSIFNHIKERKGSNAVLSPIITSIVGATEKTTRHIAVNNLFNNVYENRKNGKSERLAFEDIEPIKFVNDYEKVQTALNEQLEAFLDGNSVSFSVIEKGERKKIKATLSDNAMQPIQQVVDEHSLDDFVFLKPLSKVNLVFRNLVTTWNPFFTGRNLARDFADAMFTTKNNSFDFAKRYPHAFRTLLSYFMKGSTNDALLNVYLQNGGLASNFFDKRTSYNDLTKATRKRNGIISFIQNVNEVIEATPRFVEFSLSYNKLKNVNPMALEIALLDSANITTDFSRHGTITATLNRTLIPFLNAQIQGASKVANFVFGHKTKKEWAKLIGKMIVLGFAPELLFELLNRLFDNEDYEAIPEYTKNQYFIIPCGNGNYLKIPKGRILGTVQIFFRSLNNVISGQEDIETAVKDFTDSAVSNLAPVDLGKGLRTIFSPITDVKNNLTWYGQNIDKQSDLNKYPWARFDSDTSELAKLIGKAFNYSPKRIDYLLAQYTGILGDVLLPLTTQSTYSNPSEYFENTITSQFSLSAVKNFKYRGEAYEILDEYMYAKNSGDEQAGLVYSFMNRGLKQIDTLEDELDSKSGAEQYTLYITLREAYQELIQKAELLDKALDNIDPSTYEDKFGMTEAYRQILGAEYALSYYNTTTKSKADMAYELGIDYETFYDAYFTVRSALSKEEAIRNLRSLGIRTYYDLLCLQYLTGISLTNVQKKQVERYLKNKGILIDEKKDN